MDRRSQYVPFPPGPDDEQHQEGEHTVGLLVEITGYDVDGITLADEVSLLMRGADLGGEEPYKVAVGLLLSDTPHSRLADAIEEALKPGRWRGFDGPDGVTEHEIVQDVVAAFRKFKEEINRA